MEATRELIVVGGLIVCREHEAAAKLRVKTRGTRQSPAVKRLPKKDYAHARCFFCDVQGELRETEREAAKAMADAIRPMVTPPLGGSGPDRHPAINALADALRRWDLATVRRTTSREDS